MLNKVIAILLSLLIPISANASDMTGIFTIYYLATMVIPLTLIHLVALKYFSKKSYYRSKIFAIKHSSIALIFPLVGIMIMMYESYLVRNSVNNNEGFAAGVAIYVFLILISLLPYFNYWNDR